MQEHWEASILIKIKNSHCHEKTLRDYPIRCSLIKNEKKIRYMQLLYIHITTQDYPIFLVVEMGCEMGAIKNPDDQASKS